MRNRGVYRTVNQKPLLRWVLELIAAILVITAIRAILLYFGVNPFHILTADW